MAQLTEHLDIQIDSVYCRAICEEAGYRLRQILKGSPTSPPAHLKLLARLRRQDFDGAPSIVPSFDDLKRYGAHRTEI
jgi:hypothetical protein